MRYIKVTIAVEDESFEQVLAELDGFVEECEGAEGAHVSETTVRDHRGHGVDEGF